MRILSNVIITGSLTNTRFTAMMPVSFSIISGSGSFTTASVGVFVDENLDFRLAHENWLDGPSIFPGKNKLSGSADDTGSFCSSSLSLFNCVVSKSIVGSGSWDTGWNLGAGTSSYTASYTSSYSGSLYTGSITGSRTVYHYADQNTGSSACWFGAVGSLTSGGEQTGIWDAFGIGGSGNNDRYAGIYESIPSPQGDCDPKFLDSAAAYQIAYRKMQKWASLLCECLGNLEYVDVNFGLLYHCNFPDGNQNNNKVLTKTWKFRVRKAGNGKCILELKSWPGYKSDGGIVNRESGDVTTMVFTDQGNYTVTPKTVNYLKIPSFNSSADDYYGLSTTINAINQGGLLYFNESDSNLYLYNGASWNALAGGLSKYTEAVGNDSATSFVITHSKNTRDIVVTVRETAAPYETVYPTITMTSTNTITVDFSPTVPTSNQYTVVIV